MTKRCRSCKLDLDLSHFGIDRSREDERAMYCFDCNQIKTIARRERLKEYKRKVHRKPSKLSYPIWLLKLPPEQAVKMAIERGATSQDEIRHATRLRTDEVTDFLAKLYDQDLLCRESLRERKYKLA